MPIHPLYPASFARDPEDRDGRGIALAPSSVAAFVGRAARGPIDTPVSLFGAADALREFGPASSESPLGQALRAFFAHGGTHAVALRVASGARPAQLGRGTLRLEAASAGSWGNQLRVRVRRPERDGFELELRDAGTGAFERHGRLGFADDARRADRVLRAESRLVRWAAPAPDPSESLPEATDWLGVERVRRGSSGGAPGPGDLVGSGRQAERRGLFALERGEAFQLLVVPPDARGRAPDPALWQAAARYCACRRALLLVDPPSDCPDPRAARAWLDGLGLPAGSAVLCWPGRHGLPGAALRDFVPAAEAAAAYARSDAERGPWKPPAGLAATRNGVGRPNGPLDDRGGVAARRTLLLVEESLRRGLAWVRSEANEEPLWAEVVSRAQAFLGGLHRRGAFPGRRAAEAWFARCGAETTAARELERGIVQLSVGFALARPGEFVQLSLRLRTKQARR